MADHDPTTVDLREQLAAIEHERWSHWQRYVHSVAERNPDGSLTIPARSVERWERQMATPYADLSEREKDADREQVDLYWPLIAGRLLPKGGQTREEFGYRYRGQGRDWTKVVQTYDLEEADQLADQVFEAGAEPQVLRRTLFIGPWEPVPDTDGGER